MKLHFGPEWSGPTPERCRDCGSTEFQPCRPPAGRWDGEFCGGDYYQAKCLGCGAVWSRYAWGSGAEPADEVHWGKEGSDDPPRIPPSALANPVLALATGQVIDGVVSTVTPFGLFVDLVPRVSGMLYFESAADPAAARGYRAGQPVRVVVTAIDPDRRRVQVDLAPDGGEPAAAAAEPAGARDTGRDLG